MVDMGAFLKIKDLNKVMIDNGISVPRLRGLRLMVNEKPIDIKKEIAKVNLSEAEYFFERVYMWSDNYYELSDKIRQRKKRYLVIKNDDNYDSRVVGIRWNRIHGKMRRLLKFAIKNAMKRYEKNYSTFNKYCGRKDILYIHARIGGANWNNFDGPELAKKPWFIEKIDDPFDSTYCDIYAKIKEDN